MKSSAKKEALSPWVLKGLVVFLFLAVGSGVVWGTIKLIRKSAEPDQTRKNQQAALFPNQASPADSGQAAAPSAAPNTSGGGYLDPDIYHIPASAYPRGLNLIFFADGYLTWPEFENDVQFLLRRMRSVEPWKSYSTYNIYQIKPREVDNCGIKTQDERKPALRCRPERVNGYLGNLTIRGHFKLIVLSRRDFQSWANVARLADSGVFFSLPRTPEDPSGEETTGWFFLHMLGHAFGLKDEEYFVLAKAHSAAHQPDGPNCAPDRETAKKWWGDLAGRDPAVGYFRECAANKDYIRPTKGSLMNLGDLSSFVPEYGPVSERYLRKILQYCFSEKLYRTADDPAFFELYPEFGECVDK